MEKIHAAFIIEILGRPPEHIKEALTNISTRIGAEKGLKILDQKQHDPVPAKDSKDLFTAFAEFDVEFDTLEDYFGILITYMPAHMELVTPENITLPNSDLNQLTGAIVQRLHHYDAITKRAMVEKDKVLVKLKEVAPELFTTAQEENKNKEEPTKEKSKEESN